VIGLYAITLGGTSGAVGARGEALREIRRGEIAFLAGEMPPPLSVEALRAHEAAVRRIAEASEACLPARFGAAAQSEEALLELARAREQELMEALQLVRGREQMTLRITSIAGHRSPPPPAAPAGPGARYLEERRRARRIPELDPLRAALENISRAERVDRHSEPGLLASVYHLIDRGAGARYRRVVEETALEGLRAAVSGPWPAWSFAPEIVGLAEGGERP